MITLEIAPNIDCIEGVVQRADRDSSAPGSGLQDLDIEELRQALTRIG